MSVTGRRRPDMAPGELPDDIQPGDYWKLCTQEGLALQCAEPSNLTGTCWVVVAPMSYGYAIATLTKHTVREETDETISVRSGDGSSNSILITGHRGERWHGYIEHGVWSEV